MARAAGNTLVLETLFFADEVRDAASMLDTPPGRTKFSTGKLTMAKLRMAKQLVESMADAWNPGHYHDSYAERVDDLIAAKQAGAKPAAKRTRKAS